MFSNENMRVLSHCWTDDKHNLPAEVVWRECVLELLPPQSSHQFFYLNGMKYYKGYQNTHAQF